MPGEVGSQGLVSNGRLDAILRGNRSVREGVRNRNNRQSLRLQHQIRDFDREYTHLMKQFDFEKLDLCDFAANLKQCESDKLSEFKELHDEIRRTQKLGAPVPEGLSKALIDTFTAITGAVAENLPKLLSRGKSHALNSETAVHAPAVNAKPMDNKLAPSKSNTGPVHDSDAMPRSTFLPNVDVNAKLVQQKSSPVYDSKDSVIRPKSMTVQKSSVQEGNINANPRPKNISFEETSRRASIQNNPSIIETGHVATKDTNDDDTETLSSKSSHGADGKPATSTPKQLSRQNSYVKQQTNKATNKSHGNPYGLAKKKDKKITREVALDSNVMLSKAANVFAQQAKFYSTMETEEDDFSFGMPLRKAVAVPNIDIQEAIPDDKQLHTATSVTTIKTPVMTIRTVRIPRKATFYDKVVEINKTKQKENLLKEKMASTAPSQSSTTKSASSIDSKPIKSTVTMPMLLSLGLGALQDPKKGDRYWGLHQAQKSTSAGKPRALSTSMARRRTRQQKLDGTIIEDDAESYYSDSFNYDSDDSYDMKLLEHRKKRKKINRRPIGERIQYLYQEINFMTNPKPKRNMLFAF